MKTLLKNVLLLALFSWHIVAQAQEGMTLSLSEAINYAYDNSLTIRNAQITIADAEQQIIETRSVGLPQLNGDVNFQRFLKVPVSVLPDAFVDSARDPMTGELPEGFSREVSFQLKNNFTAGLSLNALIFDGSYIVGLRAAKSYREYVQLDLAAQKQTVKDQVIEAYLPSLLIEETLKYIDKNLVNLEDLLYGVRESYKAGFVEQLEIDRLVLTIENIKTDRRNFVRQREAALNGLKLAMGYPIDQELKVTDDINAILKDATGEELTANVNYASRPEYKVIEKGLELNQHDIDANRAGYLPSLAGFLSYQQQWFGDKFSEGFWAPTSVVGLQLNVPIFDGFNKKSKIERARLDMEKVLNQKRDFERLITFEVENARIQYLAAQERVESQRKNLELAERIYNTTQIKYTEGVGDSVEVNQAERSLFETQQNLIQAKFDLLTAKVSLDKALGK